jgi:hypothetical protein
VVTHERRPSLRRCLLPNGFALLVVLAAAAGAVS